MKNVVGWIIFETKLPINYYSKLTCLREKIEKQAFLFYTPLDCFKCDTFRRWHDQFLDPNQA